MKQRLKIIYAYAVFYTRMIFSQLAAILFLKRQKWGRKTEQGGWQDTAIDWPKAIAVFIFVGLLITYLMQR